MNQPLRVDLAKFISSSVLGFIKLNFLKTSSRSSILDSVSSAIV